MTYKPKPQHGCPYYSSCSRGCSHKGTEPNKRKTRVCGHKKPHNCPLYLEWADYFRIREDALRALKQPIINKPDEGCE